MHTSPVAVTLLVMALVACGGGGEETTPSATPEAQVQPPPAAKPAPAAPMEIAGGVMGKEELGQKVCFFTPAEIQATLGFGVAAGVADTGMLADYGMASCRYLGKENTLLVSAYWIDPAQVAAARSGMTRLSGGGKTEILPDDPDSAYVHDQQDNGVSLHYLRRNVRMQVQATSSRTDYATMKPKLLKLKRVP